MEEKGGGGRTDEDVHGGLNWCWISFASFSEVQEYVDEHPGCIHTFKRLCMDDDCPSCDRVCTPVGYVLSGWRCTQSTVKRLLVERTPVDDICYVFGGGTKRYDMLSCAVLNRKNIAHIVETKQLSLSSLQRAVVVCEDELATYDHECLVRSYNERFGVLLANQAMMQTCLEQQSNVFAATVWSFGQTVVGDHQTVFDTLADVWRNGFYYFQSP